MIKYKIVLEVETEDEELRHRKVELYGSHDNKNKNLASFFWCFGEVMSDAVEVISKIVPPDYEDFLLGLEDGLLQKSCVWVKQEKK